jgi:WD40 repeat protein
VNVVCSFLCVASALVSLPRATLAVGDAKSALEVRQRWSINALELNLTSTLTFSSDGNILAAGGNDGTIRLFDLKNGNTKKSWKAHESAVRLLAFHPKADRIVSCNGGKVDEVKMWDARKR